MGNKRKKYRVVLSGVAKRFLVDVKNASERAYGELIVLLQNLEYGPAKGDIIVKSSATKIGDGKLYYGVVIVGNDGYQYAYVLLEKENKISVPLIGPVI